MIVEPELLNIPNIEQYLSMVVELRNRNTGLQEGWKYASCEDFVLREGLRFKKQELDFVQLPKKACFNNCFTEILSRVDKDDLFYCEGWAMGVIPVHHAWLCDQNGVVHDPTWWGERIGVDNYIGVPFEWDYVLDQYEIHSRPGLFFPDGVRVNKSIVRGEARIAKLDV